MIDKYCLQVVLCSWFELAVSKSQLHSHGIMATPDVAWWTPEDAWMER